jgi:hypothetical protein
MVRKPLKVALQALLIPTSVARVPEENGPLIVVDTVYLRPKMIEISAYFRSD